MANPHSVKPRASFPKQLANWTNSAGGLDLTLRLFNALTLIAAEICVDDVIVERSIIATEQLGLGESPISWVYWLCLRWSVLGD